MPNNLRRGLTVLFTIAATIALVGEHSLEAQGPAKDKPMSTRITIAGREYDGAIDVVVGQ